MTSALPSDKKNEPGFVEGLKVYITGSGADPTHAADSCLDEAVDEDGNELIYDDIEGLDMVEQEGLSEEPKIDERAEHNDGLRICSRRPDLKRVVEATMSHSPSERIAVLVCGPSQLSRDLRKECKA